MLIRAIADELPTGEGADKVRFPLQRLVKMMSEQQVVDNHDGYGHEPPKTNVLPKEPRHHESKQIAETQRRRRKDGFSFPGSAMCVVEFC